MHTIGTLGIIIFYFILAKLSALMGRGLMMGSYYQWYYIAIIIVFLTIPLHLYFHLVQTAAHSLEDSLDFEGIYISLLLLGNIIVFAVSIKYWWWLKEELLG